MFFYEMFDPSSDRGNPDAWSGSLVDFLGGLAITVLALYVVHYLGIGRHERQRRREDMEAVENRKAIVRKRIEQDKEK